MQKKKAVNEYKAAAAVGDVDTDLIPLLDYINSLDSCYTTSSCAGRISLLEDVGSKEDNTFLGKWHHRVGEDEVLDALDSSKGVVWFRYEPTILHIVCRTLEDAAKLLKLALRSGFKRSGIQTLKNQRYMAEVCSTEKIDAPVMDSGRMLADKEYIKYLASMANNKFSDGQKKLSRLEKELRNHL